MLLVGGEASSEPAVSQHCLMVYIDFPSGRHQAPAQPHTMAGPLPLTGGGHTLQSGLCSLQSAVCSVPSPLVVPVLVGLVSWRRERPGRRERVPAMLSSQLQ